MTTMTKLTHEELIKDEKFLTAFVEVKSPAELGMILEEKGITLEEGITLEQAYDIIQANKNDELVENDLDNVNGGIAITTAILSAGMLAFGAANIAFYASYGYYKIVKKY